VKVRKIENPSKSEALLDSGAGGLFIDATFAKKNEFTLCDLPEPLNAYNMDGTLNKKGTITSYIEADLQMKTDHKDTIIRHRIRKTKSHSRLPLVTR